MKVCPLTRISSPAAEICPNGLLTRDVLYTEEDSCTAMAQQNTRSFWWAAFFRYLRGL